MYIGMMMTSAFLVEGSTEFLVHVTTGFEGCTERVGHAVDGAAAFDFAGAAEAGDTTRFVSFGDAGGTVLFKSIECKCNSMHLIG